MSRVGTKRADRRWKAPDGTVWASKFEWKVYEGLRKAGVTVRKCDSRDTVRYIERKRNGRCLECGSNSVVQDRTYTPDLFVSTPREESPLSGYYIEAKGYFRADKRQLFRCLVASNKNYAIRVILERDGWVTKGKTKYTDYFARYLKKTPVHVWDGDIPGDWK
jgi:hypothetical protein